MTFDKRYLARTVKGEQVYLPDEVVADQQDYDGERITVLHLSTGRKRRAILRGDLYGLGTGGIGDPVVSLL